MLDFLPDDPSATLLGRMLFDEGPTPVSVVGGRLYDLSAVAPTVADLLRDLPPGQALPKGRDLGPLEDHAFAPQWQGGGGNRLLAPVDLQCIKAAGVTFAVSALERVIEERARGDAATANEIREAMRERLGSDLAAVKPGSEGAARLKALLIESGYWSQYLEVAIGPHAEVFTKAPVLSSVGWGDLVGIRADSEWNNPEPEVVLVCDPKGNIRGATLGNDVNLRDIEGKSALLLGKAKDNNASCSIGPFIRLFDDGFSLDDVRKAEVTLEIVGQDNFRLEGSSNMALISRDPTELAAQAFSENHQYPDGFVMFLGTMFAPIEDRDVPAGGFTHKRGDIVRVASPTLGVLENQVVLCQDAPPWDFGISDLFRNLAGRGLLRA
jgi:fumarylacetoacetate (FAA) hydrolase family protein